MNRWYPSPRSSEKRHGMITWIMRPSIYESRFPPSREWQTPSWLSQGEAPLSRDTSQISSHDQTARRDRENPWGDPSDEDRSWPYSDNYETMNVRIWDRSRDRSDISSSSYDRSVSVYRRKWCECLHTPLHSAWSKDRSMRPRSCRCRSWVCGLCGRYHESVSCFGLPLDKKGG